MTTKGHTLIENCTLLSTMAEETDTSRDNILRMNTMTIILSRSTLTKIATTLPTMKSFRALKDPDTKETFHRGDT